MVLWAGLRERRNRLAHGLTLVEGFRAARDALRAHGRPGVGWAVDAVLVGDGADPAAAGQAERMAAGLPVPAVRLSRAAYARLSSLQAPDGVAAVLRPPSGPWAGAALLDRLWRDPAARLLAAAGVQDPGNAGALARVAEAAGATGCVFAGGADVWHPRFLRGSMGSAFRIPCAGVSEDDLRRRWTRGAPLRLLAADARGEVGMERADWRPPMALLVGGEGEGVPGAFRAAAAGVAVPMSGGAESLNVAVAAGILLYAARTRWP